MSQNAQLKAKRQDRESLSWANKMIGLMLWSKVPTRYLVSRTETGARQELARRLRRIEAARAQ